MAADKAPSLNPQFTNNVGTIEVIVLRCKTDLDDLPPPKASREQNSHKPTSGADAKRSSTAAPSASAKAAAPQQSEIGGLFGLFDGAFDLLNLDGAADEHQVGPDGRVKPNPPPGMAWDSIVGMWIPEHAYGPPRQPNAGRDPGSGITDQIKAMQGEIEEAQAQLDGYGGQPGVIINQWGDRGRDDMRGDKYLGLEVQDRSAYKQYIRETGESVSSLTGGLPNRNPRLTNDQGYARAPQVPHQAHRQARYQWNPPAFVPPPIHMPLQPNPQQVAEELEQMRRKILDFMQKHPDGNQTRAKRELAMVTRLQTLQQQGQGSLAKFPLWLTEALTDMEIRRQYTLRVQQKYPHTDFSELMEKLDRERVEALRDPMYQKDFSLDDVDDCLALYYMLYERTEIFKQFLQEAEKFSKVSADEVRARINFICFQRDKADEAVKEMERRAKARDDARQAQGWKTDQQGPFQQAAQGCGDGAYNYAGPQQFQNAWTNPAPQGENKGGWQQVGAGTWNPAQQFAQNQPQPMNGPGFGGGQQATGWAADNQANRGASGLSDVWKPNAGNDGGNKSSSKKTYEHNFSERNDQSKQGWGGSQKKSSTQQSNKDNAWNDNKGDQTQTGNNQGWGAPGGSNNACDNGWGGDSRQKSKSRSVQTAIKVQNEEPKAYIKPYWKDWNRPFSRSESSEPNTKKKRDEPREVYNYPASTLPAVPDKEAKDASHGIQTSRGADYSHKCRKPIYIDTMEHPYAVFSFKYRSKEALEKILKLKIDEVDVQKVQEQVEKDRLMTMPKHKLIEELMDKRAPPKSVSKKSVANGGSKAASGWGDKGGDNKPGSGWSNQGDGTGAANGWDAGGNNENSWEEQNKQSDRGKHTGSNHNSRKSKPSQRNDLAGWDDAKLTNAPFTIGGKGNNGGANNGWDNSPAANGGWDGHNEAGNLSWVPRGVNAILQDQWNVPDIQQSANQVKFTTPDSPGVKLPTALQKRPANDMKKHADASTWQPRAESTFSDWAREDAERFGDIEEEEGLRDD